MAELEEAARQLGLKLPIARKVVATRLALALLRVRFADSEVEWRMLAKKAEEWVNRQGVPEDKRTQLDKWIESVLGA